MKHTGPTYRFRIDTYTVGSAVYNVAMEGIEYVSAYTGDYVFNELYYDSTGDVYMNYNSVGNNLYPADRLYRAIAEEVPQDDADVV
jgi:hypothetical protein